MTSASYRLDHCSLTVPDLVAAVAFFTEVVGAQVLYERRLPPKRDPASMEVNYHAHPDAGFRMAKLAIGRAEIELFEYEAPDQDTRMPRNCDVGGSHLGFLVTDMAAAIDRARRYPGVRTLGEPQTLPENHPLAGRTWIYFLTPWGQQLEFVADPARVGQL